MTQEDALQHSKVWHHAADEMANLMNEAKRCRDWGSFRPMSAVTCLARSVAEGYEQFSEGKIGT